MNSYGRVAKSVAEQKALYPERYCSERGCLWKTAEVAPDGKHYP